MDKWDWVHGNNLNFFSVNLRGVRAELFGEGQKFFGQTFTNLNTSSIDKDPSLIILINNFKGIFGLFFATNGTSLFLLK